MPTTSAGRQFSLLSRSSELFDQSWHQCAWGKPVKTSRSGAASATSAAAAGKRSRAQDDAGVLLGHCVCVGLGEDRAHHRDEALGALRDAGEQVAHEVRAAALRRSAGQRGGDRVDEAGVSVRGDQADAAEAPSDQAAQEGEPGGAVLAGDDVEAERLPEAVGVDSDRVHHAGVDGAAALATLHLGRVHDQIRVGGAVERAGAKVLDDRVERLREP